MLLYRPYTQMIRRLHKHILSYTAHLQAVLILGVNHCTVYSHIGVHSKSSQRFAALHVHVDPQDLTSSHESGAVSRASCKACHISINQMVRDHFLSPKAKPWTPHRGPSWPQSHGMGSDLGLELPSLYVG